MNRFAKPVVPTEAAQEAINLERDHAFLASRYPGWQEQRATFSERAVANPNGPEAAAEAIALRYRLAAGLSA
ncbi:hypothetical protein RCH10_000801 [Variovorax sp. GrIS 2.14]|uniref:hypothetical protein n=1 Tax=Variovorax sp. GrIS 2.14 TaxID=3071709 RepID=UPI0038F6DB41